MKMKKLDGNVKATKLMIDDHLEVGGVMHRITMLTHDFGRGKKRDRVRIHAHTLDKKSFVNLSVPANAEFAIYNQNTKK